MCRQGSESLILTKDERNENWYPISLHSWRNCFCACECFGGKLKAARTFSAKTQPRPQGFSLKKYEVGENFARAK